MYPIGTRVRIQSVDHLGRFRRPKRLLQRTGRVIAHHADGYHEVEGLVRAPITYVFPPDTITAA